MKTTVVKGRKKGEVTLFALSTCAWCKKTRDLLDQLGVEYSYIYVDLLIDAAEKAQAMKELERWNPSCSFPTLVINDKCIVGFKDDAIKEALKNGG